MHAARTQDISAEIEINLDIRIYISPFDRAGNGNSLPLFYLKKVKK